LEVLAGIETVPEPSTVCTEAMLPPDHVWGVVENQLA
jgi:hypothetical protein